MDIILKNKAKISPDKMWVVILQNSSYLLNEYISVCVSVCVCVCRKIDDKVIQMEGEIY